MKLTSLLLLLLAAALLSGCATDPEDHAFFNEGWLHPDKNTLQTP